MLFVVEHLYCGNPCSPDVPWIIYLREKMATFKGKWLGKYCRPMAPWLGETNLTNDIFGPIA